ncbi:MAG: LuxR C-terminal-related transcriptional regulator [Pseudomonadota bacterium]
MRTTQPQILVSVEDGKLRHEVVRILQDCGQVPLALATVKQPASRLATELSAIIASYGLDIGGRDTTAEGLRSLRRDYVGVPIVAIVEDGEALYASEALAAGAGDYLTRSMVPDCLAFRIEVLLAPFGQARSASSPDTAVEGADVPPPPAAYLIGTPFETLTQRELDVMLGVVAGNANKTIAHRLNLSPKTVELHRARVMDKAGVRSLSQLVRLAIKAGIDPNFG